MTAIIAATPQRIARVLPLLAAVCRKEPPTRDGHHGIPHQTDRGKRKVKLREALPAAKTIDDRGFVKFARDTLQRGVKTERNVPDLSRKDEQDGAEFHAELAVRKNRNHGQHDSR